MKRTLIRGGFVVTGDPEIPDIPKGEVLIEDGRIVAVGSDLKADDAEILDAVDRIVMPGFVDGHRHIWQGALRSVCADGSISDYVRTIRMHAARFFTAEDMYAAQLHGALEALDAGVTSVTDYCHNLLSPDHAHESIRGLRESGLRTVWNYGFNFPPQPEPVFRTLEERIRFGRDLATQEFSSRDARVTLGVAPEEAVFSGDPERTRAQFEFARDMDARVFWHCNSGGDASTYSRDVALIDELGVLGPELTLVHMHNTHDDEWQRVADSGASVAFTPETEMQMGMMWPSTKICESLGVPISIGTDITSNNSADMFSALRIGLQGLRCHHISQQDDFTMLTSGIPLSCADALRWGTLGGARALGLEDRIGSLSPGKQADVVLLRGDSLGMAGWDRAHPERAIVLHAGVDDVDTVLVGGEVVKAGGRMVADVARACHLLETASERVHARTADAGGLEIPLDEIVKRLEAVATSEDGRYAFDS